MLWLFKCKNFGFQTHTDDIMFKGYIKGIFLNENLLKKFNYLSTQTIEKGKLL